jgi:DNA excision repair protein ERCC-6-like 2
MGLGKTIQVAALLLALFGKTGRKLEDHANNRLRRRRDSEENSKIFSALNTNPFKTWTRPCLIVCPASVIDNWRDELSRWGYFLVSHLLGSNQDGGCLEAIEDAKHGRSFRCFRSELS